MKVTLPRRCSGREIIEAFKKAAAIEVQDMDHKGEPYDSRRNWKWIPEEYEGEDEYEPGSVRRIVHRGVTAIHHRWQYGRKYLFFGKKYGKWTSASSGEDMEGPWQIRLLPLREDAMYDSVNIRNGRELVDALGFPHDWQEHLNHWNREHDIMTFRASVEKIIAGLFEQLQPQTTIPT